MIVTAMLAFAVPLLVMGIRHLRLDNNVESWLPANDTESTIFNWYRKHFNEEERVIVTWKGSTLDDHRTELLRVKLLGKFDADGLRRGGIPYVDSVVSSREVLARMVGYGVPQEEAVARLQGTLIGQGLLKVRLTDSGRQQRSRTIAQLIKQVKSDLGLKLSVVESNLTESVAEAEVEETQSDDGESVASDEESSESVELASLVMPAYDFEIGWKEFSPKDPRVADIQAIARDLRGFATSREPQGRVLIDDCFIAPGAPVAIAVTLSEAGRADSSSTLAAIRTAAIQVGIPEKDLVLGGRSVATMELNNSVIQAAWNQSAPLWKLHDRSVMLLSGLVGMFLAIVSLRNLRLAIIVLGVTYYAAFVSTAIVPLSGGTMNMVLIVLPTFVMVVSLSGAIHVANYISHATLENPHGAVDRATRLAFLPCFNSVFTTVLGLLSLLTSTLAPVRDFGIYSSIGAAISLFMVVVVLPALLKLFPTRGVAQPEGDLRRWQWFGHHLIHFSRPIHIVCWGVCLVAASGLIYFQTETKVIRNFADETRLIRDYRYLEENLAGISSVETVIKFDRASQKSLRFLQRMEVVRQVANNLRQHPQVSGTVCLPDFQPVRETPAEDAGTREKVLFYRRSSETEKRIKAASTADVRSFLSVAGEAADLKEPGDGLLNSAGEELWRITAQVPALADVNYGQLTQEMNQAVQQVTKYHPGVGHVVTGTVPLFMRTQQALLDSLIMSFGLAFLTIAVVMMYALKDVLAGLLSMIPNVLPIAAVFGAVSWAGTRIDIGTMITASVALGLAVDSCLHLTTWYRNGLIKGQSQDEAIIECLTHCGPAMLQTTAGISLAMLVLYPSDLVMISRFGWLMSLLIGATYLGDIILLPVMLRGLLGQRIARVVEQEQQRRAMDTVDASERGLTSELIELPPADTAESRVDDATIPTPHIPLDRARSRRKRHAG